MTLEHKMAAILVGANVNFLTNFTAEEHAKIRELAIEYQEEMEWRTWTRTVAHVDGCPAKYECRECAVWCSARDKNPQRKAAERRQILREQQNKARRRAELERELESLNKD